MQNGEIYNPNKALIGIFIPEFKNKSQETSLLTEKKRFHDAYIKQIFLTACEIAKEKGLEKAVEYIEEKAGSMVSGETERRINKVVRYKTKEERRG